MLQDILETGEAWQEKAYCLTATYDGAVAWNTLERKQRSMIAEAVDYTPHTDTDIVITDNSMRLQRRDTKRSTVQGTHVTLHLRQNAQRQGGGEE